MADFADCWESGLSENAKRAIVLCLAGLVFSTIIYQVTVLYLTWHLGSSSKLSEQIRGARLTPGNADAWDRIGEALAGNFDDAQPAQALSFFSRAVKADQLSARNWMDLAQAYEIQGNNAQAKASYEQALSDYPISADVSWRYGNFLLRHGETSEGLMQVHHALMTDPRLIPLAISQLWRFDPDVHMILDDVLPSGQSARFQALDFFAGKHENAAALETWKEIAGQAKTQTIDIQSVFPFLQELIKSDQTSAAVRVWREALGAAHWIGSIPTIGSQIWDGGFEEPILNGGLDWRFEQPSNAYISIDSSVNHSGHKSLRVDFTGGANSDFQDVHQVVPVEPSTHYLFQCFMRTQAISTESGMRFEILDLNDNEVSLMTSDLTGTNPWTPVRTEFVTGQNTHFLDIRLRRLPSRLFDNKLSGTVWVDDVSLKSSPAVGLESHP